MNLLKRHPLTRSNVSCIANNKKNRVSKNPIFYFYHFTWKSSKHSPSKSTRRWSPIDKFLCRKTPPQNKTPTQQKQKPKNNTTKTKHKHKTPPTPQTPPTPKHKHHRNQKQWTDLERLLPEFSGQCRSKIADLHGGKLLAYVLKLCLIPTQVAPRDALAPDHEWRGKCDPECGPVGKI